MSSIRREFAKEVNDCDSGGSNAIDSNEERVYLSAFSNLVDIPYNKLSQ